MQAEVIGDPIAHSKSPLIHNFWLKTLGVDAHYQHALVKSVDVGEYLASRRQEADWVGCNVTMPHKEAVIPFLDELDPVAQHLGAANTIVKGKDGKLRGFNTDVVGVFEPLSKHAKPSFPTHVQILGSGGAAKAAAIGSVAAGYGDIDVFNRTPEKAEGVLKMVGSSMSSVHGLDALAPMHHPDTDEQRYSHILINATSMGMHGQNPVPVDLSAYYSDTIVFDMVYAPLETPLLAQARANGMRTIDGLEMLVGQAAAAFELFFGVKAPRDQDEVLRRMLLAA